MYVFYTKCLFQSSSRSFETFFAAINIPPYYAILLRITPYMHSETHEGKSKITENFVPVYAMKVHKWRIELHLHSFLTFVRNGGVCLVMFKPQSVYPRKITPCTF
jgi:hypothetical protein